MCRKSPAKIFGIIIMIIMAIAAFGSITMLLWNWLIPTIFDGPSLTYFQALGLLVLSKILFSGGPSKHDRHSKRYSHEMSWKKGLRDRMESDTVDHSKEMSSSTTDQVSE